MITYLPEQDRQVRDDVGYIPFEQYLDGVTDHRIYFLSSTGFGGAMGSPVSRRLLRLERIAGQPVETACKNLDSCLSREWTTVSLTDSPKGSSSMTQRETPSALSSGES